MKTCNKCNSSINLIESNNPLVSDICSKCIYELIDVSNLEQFAFLCRTLNWYFYPALYINLYKETPDNIVERYIEQMSHEEITDYYDSTTDVWHMVEEEWNKASRHELILAKIEPIKKSFIERCNIKWGTNFTFQEYVQLEDLFINTVKNYNITDPIRLDLIKKVCRSAIILDQVYAGGDTKEIKEFTMAHASIMKTANIDDLGTTLNDSDETIKTVAALYKYLEKKGFNFTFYDDVERDIIDKTINDIKESIRYEIINATGLEDLLENIKRQYEQDLLTEEDSTAQEQVPIEQLIEDQYDKMEHEADAMFENQEVEIDDGIEYD